MKTKKNLLLPFLICLLSFFSLVGVSLAQQENPYLPNIWDSNILEKAETYLDELATQGKKEILVDIISTIKIQLGILTDAKSQYILFELGHLAEQRLPKAISNADQMRDDNAQFTSGTNSDTGGEVGNNYISTSLGTGTESPIIEEEGANETGKASYYASSLNGNHTANGDIFDNDAFTAAHKTLPFNTRIKVTNTRNNLRVIVRINDRGPFTPGRVLDLSQAAFKALNNDSLRAGILDVSREPIE